MKVIFWIIIYNKFFAKPFSKEQEKVVFGGSVYTFSIKKFVWKQLFKKKGDTIGIDLIPFPPVIQTSDKNSHHLGQHFLPWQRFEGL